MTSQCGPRRPNLNETKVRRRYDVAWRVGCDDMIAHMVQNKNLNSIVTELFIRERQLNISLVFITQSYFKVPKDVRMNTTHFFCHKNFK